jgi:hypothetical protein
VSGERYRFLLRLPEELRPRLTKAAARAGRSLNAELVHRLQRSLEEDEIAPRRRYFGRMERPGSTPQGRRQLMTRRRKRLALSGLSALVLVAGATALAVLSTSGGAGKAEGEAETPTALAAHLAQLKQARPANPGFAEDDPGSAAGAE